MIKNLTCIECPKGCKLTVEVEDGQVVKVSGNECEKGVKYAVSEIENPARILTTTVLTRNLPIKMIPVRTDQPIPKNRIFDAMAAVKTLRVSGQVKVGDVLARNFLGLGVNLIATRDCRESVEAQDKYPEKA